MRITKKYLSGDRLSMLKGKWLGGQLTLPAEDIAKLFGHIARLEEMLNEGDENDAFGTEGWRRHA